MKTVLGAFALDSWESLKESFLKAPLTAAVRFCGQAAQNGHADMHEAATKWVEQLGLLKRVLALLREHRKMNPITHFRGKLLELAAPLQQTLTNLRAMGIVPAMTLHLLALKAAFHAEFEASESLVAAATVVFNGGLVAAFRLDSDPAGANAQGSNVPSPSLWCQSLVADGLKLVLAKVPEAKEADQNSKLAKEFVTDLGAVRLLFQTHFGDAPLLAELVQDLMCIEVVLGFTAGTANPSATGMKEATDRVNLARLTPFRIILESWSVWQVATLAAATLMQTSSKDRLADVKMKRALDILEDNRLPHVAQTTDDSAADSPPSSGVLRVVEASLLVNGTVLEVISESLACAEEAFALWSDMQAESQRALVQTWADLLVKSFASFNEALWLIAAGCFKKAELWDEEEAPAEAGQRAAVVGQLGGRLGRVRPRRVAGFEGLPPDLGLLRIFSPRFARPRAASGRQNSRRGAEL
jgi:hypothetical protein